MPDSSVALRFPMGPMLRPLEATLGAVWSVGELVQAFLRPDEWKHDPHREQLLEDIAKRGFYPELPRLELERRRNGWLVGDNPHRRLAGTGTDRVVAQLTHAKRNPRRKLVVLCHCYGLPSPGLMRSLFGLDEVDVDVATNVMAHHARGSYRGWPGAGFTSSRLSTFIENLRTAVAGVRALTASLREAYAYEQVTVVGFSIGGQLALHLANTGLVDRALVYCPAVSMYRSATELGLMETLHPPVKRLLARTGSEFSFDALQVTEPLGYPLRIKERDLHVVVQRHDALAPPSQVAAIRERYPSVPWHELRGTHLWPAGRRRLHQIVRDVLAD